jgi:DNA-3-methyladenine glycosylase II
MMPTPVKYLDHLLKDPLLVPLLTDAEPRELKPVSNSAFYLYSTIIRQQLSTRVGNVLLDRFLNIYGGHEPTPAGVTATPLETLQSIGLSRQKAGYIKNVAQFEQDHGLGAEKLNAMTDAEVTAYITK